MNGQSGIHRSKSPILVLALVLAGVAMLTQCSKESSQRESAETIRAELRESIQKDIDKGKLGAKWAAYQLAGTGITLDLPAEPEEFTVPLPPEMQTQGLRSKGFVSSTQDESLTVSITHLESTKDINLNTQWLAESFPEGLRERSEVSDLQYSLGHDVPAQTTVSGSLKLKNVPFDMSGFSRAKGRKALSIVVLSRSDSAETKAGSDRILKSIVID